MLVEKKKSSFSQSPSSHCICSCTVHIFSPPCLCVFYVINILKCPCRRSALSKNRKSTFHSAYFFLNSLFHFPTQFSTLRVKTATFEHLCYQMVHYPLNGTCWWADLGILPEVSASYLPSHIRGVSSINSIVEPVPKSGLSYLGLLLSKTNILKCKNSMTIVW